MRTLALAGALTAVLLSASAPNALAQASPDTASVKAGTYKVEAYHTQIGFSVLHLGFTPFSGFFSGASGSLKLDPTHPDSSALDVTVPVQSVTTTVAQLDGELKGAQWFDAAQFPNATFKSTKVVLVGKDRATITGDLTLHGVTKPVVLSAHFVGAGVNPLDKAYTVGFEATGTFKRSDFGVKTYVPMVGDDVALTIAGAFELQG
ncbi:MAG TPA: YceI family protein [Caulobacteraceae bacterium]